MKGTGVRINHNAFVVDEVLSTVGVGEIIAEEKKNKKKKKKKDKDSKKKNESSNEEVSKKKGKKKDKGDKKKGKASISIDIPNIPSTEEINRKALAFVKREKKEAKAANDPKSETEIAPVKEKESKKKNKKKKEKGKKEKGKEEKKGGKNKKDKKKSRRSVEERVAELQGHADRAAVGDFAIDIDTDGISTETFNLGDISEKDLTEFYLPVIDDKD